MTREAIIDARRDELLLVKEFAALMREHPKSVYRRIAEGRQPGVIRCGREIRIDLARIVMSVSEEDRSAGTR